MTDASLFDCDQCETMRAQIGDLEEQLAWMRRRLNLDRCDRCFTDPRQPGYTTRYGFGIVICGACWRPGDELNTGGMDLTVETLTRLRFTRGDRTVVIEAVDPRRYRDRDREIYAPAVRLVEGGDPGEHPASGIAWRGNAIRLAKAAFHGEQPS